MSNHISNSTLAIGAILQGKAYRYRIEKVLGQGAFGITYLATIIVEGNLGSLAGSLVAIKEFFMKGINGREKTIVTCSSERGLYDDYKKKFTHEA